MTDVDKTDTKYELPQVMWTRAGDVRNVLDQIEALLAGLKLESRCQDCGHYDVKLPGYHYIGHARFSGRCWSCRELVSCAHHLETEAGTSFFTCADCLCTD